METIDLTHALDEFENMTDEECWIRYEQQQQYLSKVREKKRKRFPLVKALVVQVDSMVVADIPLVFSEFAGSITNTREVSGGAWVITFASEEVLRQVLAKTYTFQGIPLHVESCNAN